MAMIFCIEALCIDTAHGNTKTPGRDESLNQCCLESNPPVVALGHYIQMDWDGC